ncbi:MAG: AbrB/MazE/SpoVT family DNA-binding domain-containing protein, partial [Methylocystis sp.]|nr:AbrB/MazE/SpoVT family DNA-binding domain-containing protein [Methylocystis sp.]
RVRIAKWGNSAAVRLPKAALDELRVGPGEDLEFSVRKGVIELRSIPKVRSRSLDELLAEADRIGWENQPPLEDWSAVEPPWPPYDAKPSE